MVGGHIKQHASLKGKLYLKANVIFDENDYSNFLALINQVNNPEWQDKVFNGVSINRQRVDMEDDIPGTAVAVIPKGSDKDKLQSMQKKATICNWSVVKLGKQSQNTGKMYN